MCISAARRDGLPSGASWQRSEEDGKGKTMSSKAHILIIEDEKSICNFIKAALQVQEYRISVAHTAAEGLSVITSRCPDLVLLDLGLPDMDGSEIIRKVREWSSLPVIVISARTQEQDKVRMLDLGADDYITKPFGTSELLARIRAALRHSNQVLTQGGGASTCYRAGDLCIDFVRRQVTLEGQEVHLTAVEYKLVSLLARNAGRVVTHDAIMTQVWGPYVEADNRILRVNMANIRRKIEKNPAEPQYIFTEIGIGYRMREETT